jgi:hypothetical protein
MPPRSLMIVMTRSAASSPIALFNAMRPERQKCKIACLLLGPTSELADASCRAPTELVDLQLALQISLVQEQH